MKLTREDAQKLTKRVNEHSEEIHELAKIILKPYTESLNKFMINFRERLRDEDNPPTGDELNLMMQSIPTELYFAAEGELQIGINEDISKLIRMELYNNAHLDAEGTVDARKSAAELEVIKETIINSAYVRANKLLKDKIKAAYELLNSVKLSFRRELAKSGTERD